MINFTANFTKYQIYNSIWSKFFQNLIEVKQTCFKLQSQMQSEATFKIHTPDCWLSQETTASSSSVFSAERWDSNTFLNFCKIQRKNEGNFLGKQNFSITHTFIINVQHSEIDMVNLLCQFVCVSWSWPFFTSEAVAEAMLFSS